MTTRPPAVAGSFYEASPERLLAQVQACFAANKVITFADEPRYRLFWRGPPPLPNAVLYSPSSHANDRPRLRGTIPSP